MTNRFMPIALLCVLGAYACAFAGNGHDQLAGENANFGKEISLEGTRRGPTYFYMTKAERQEYVRYMTKDPEGQKKFAEIRAQADNALTELPPPPHDDWIEGVVWHQPGLALARAYLVTKDKRYLKRASEMMVRCANIWMGYYTSLEGRQARGRGNLWIWGPGGGMLRMVKLRDGSMAPYHWDMLWVVLAYDLLAADMPDADERTCRAFMKNACDGLIEWKHVDPPRIPGQGEGGNMAAQTIGHWSVYGFAIGYDAFTDWCISHSGRGSGMRDMDGMLDIIQRHFHDRAIQEEAPAYWWYIADGVLSLAHCAIRARGIDLWNMAGDRGMTFRGVVDGKIAISYPVEDKPEGMFGIRGPHWGESTWDWMVYGTELQEWVPGIRSGYKNLRWEIILRGAYETTKDEGYGWFLSLVPKSAQRNSHGVPIAFAGLTPPVAPSRVFPNAGLAMLRADETPNYWMGKGMAMMVRGGERMRSAPGDSFGIRLHGRGKLLYPDWNIATYEDYNLAGWSRAGLRRSSLLIDGKESWYHRTTWRQKSYPEVKHLSMRASRYGNDRSERAFMMTKEYLLDLFDITVHEELVPEMEFMYRPKDVKQYRGWSGASLRDENGDLPKSFTFDWCLNAAGAELPYEWWTRKPSRQLTVDGWPNRFLKEETRSETGDSIRIDYRQKTCGVRMHMLGESGTTLFTAKAPTPTRIAVVRRQGAEATFAALHEPYFDAPVISQFTYLHQPKAGDDPRVVGVKVAAEAYVDRLFVTLGLEGLKGMDGSGIDRLKRGKKEVANLTRNWLFKKDAGEVGQTEKWFAPDYDRADWRKVDAGVNWQDFDRGYYGGAWYAKTIEPLQLPPGKKAYLLFEGVDEDCWVYIDGKKVYQRVAEIMGDLWDTPFILDVTDAVTPGRAHQLVVKVWKMKYQTGLYYPVRLLVEGPPPAAPRPDPIVIVTSSDDSNERIRFRAQAYLRDNGAQLIARGDIDALCIWAPGVRARDAFVLNGKSAPFRNVSGYVIFGDMAAPEKAAKVVLDRINAPITRIFAGEKVSLKVRLCNLSGGEISGIRIAATDVDGKPLGAGVKLARLVNGAAQELTVSATLPAAMAGRKVSYLVRASYAAGGKQETSQSLPQNLVVSLPAEITFPQKHVNLDAQAGGKLLTRITNRSSRTITGKVAIQPGTGLKVRQESLSFAGLKPGHRTDLAFDLDVAGAKSGSTVAVAAIVTVPTPDQGQMRHENTTDAAIGSVITEIAATYDIPYYDHTEGVPGKLKPRAEWKGATFDYFLVRAPGYTVRIDKFSGMSRWIMDPMGTVRTSWAKYPWDKFRSRKKPSATSRQLRLPGLVGVDGFEWYAEAGFLGAGKDAGGNPTLRFAGADGKVQLTYTFTPEMIRATAAGSEATLHQGFADLPGKGGEYLATDGAIGFSLPTVYPLEQNAPPTP